MPAKKKLMVDTTDRRMSVEEFTIFMLKWLMFLADYKYPGIHTVYSGFNEYFREYFPDLNPVEEVTRLTEEGAILCRPSRNGAFIKLPYKRAKKLQRF